jgi:DNA-binding response OmpR family regulator
MSKGTGQRAGSKNIREPRFAGIGAFGQDTAELYKFGPFRLEPAERKLSRNNEPVVLTPKAYDTLLLLVRASSHLQEKDELTGRSGPTLSSRRPISRKGPLGCCKSPTSA